MERQEILRKLGKLEQQYSQLMEKRRATWQRTALMIWDKIADHRAGNAFLKIPKTKQYQKIVKKPLSLEMIKQRIRTRQIKSTPEFHRDVTLCLANAVAFEGEQIQHMAIELMNYCDLEMQSFLILHS